MYKTKNHTLGIILMIINAFSMSLLYIIVKILVRYFGFTSNQVAVLYKLTILMFTIMSCLRVGLVNNLKTKKFTFHFLRGVFSILGSLSMFYAVSVMNILNAAAISELTPIFMVLAGVFIFKEQFTADKIVLLFFTILGVFLIEGLNMTVNLSHYFVLISLLFWSINNVIIKKLTQTERLKSQLFYSSLFALIFAFPLSFFSFTFNKSTFSIVLNYIDWPSISIQSLFLVIIASIASLFHKISFFKAYQVSDMSIVGFFDYLRLPFTCFFSCFFLDESLPGINILLGYMFIIVCNVYFIFARIKS